jgi:hypothetical protein
MGTCWVTSRNDAKRKIVMISLHRPATGHGKVQRMPCCAGGGRAGRNASQAAFHAAPERPRRASHPINLPAIAVNALWKPAAEWHQVLCHVRPFGDCQRPRLAGQGDNGHQHPLAKAEFPQEKPIEWGAKWAFPHRRFGGSGGGALK